MRSAVLTGPCFADQGPYDRVERCLGSRTAPGDESAETGQGIRFGRQDGNMRLARGIAGCPPIRGPLDLWGI